MIKIITFLSLLAPIGAAELELLKGPTGDLSKGGWSLTAQWFMKTAMQFHDDKTFDYWYKSDVSSGAKYPVKGTWKWAEDGTLEIQLTESNPEVNLITKRLHLVRYNEKIGLLPDYSYKRYLDDKTKESIPNSLLISIEMFVPEKPYGK